MSKNITKLPNWICKRIDEAGLERIRAAVQKAELSTSAEIVPMIVQRSSTVAHVPMSLFLLLSLIWVTAVPYLATNLAHLMTNMNIAFVEMAGLVFAFVISVVLGQTRFAQRIFVPKVDQISQVDHRAELEFFESNIKTTRESTGILIFVSLLEHRAVVLADGPIAAKFPAETWNEIVNGLLERVKAGDLAGGFAWAIERSGSLVAPHFPIGAGDKDELSNDLVIKF